MRWITAIVTGAALLPTITAQAQFMADMTAAMGVSNTLSASSAGPNVNLYMGRARDVASTANSYAQQYQQYSAATAGGGQIGMVAGAGAPAAGMPGMAGMPGAMGAGQQQVQQIDPMQAFLQAINGVNNTAAAALSVIASRDPNIQYVTVLTGERVLCAVTGAMLADVDVVRVPVEKDKRDEGLEKWRKATGINVKDDGVLDNGIAGDGIFGDVKVSTGNVISPEANRLRAVLMRLLYMVEYMAPSNVVDYHSMVSPGPTADIKLNKTGIVVETQSGKVTNYSQVNQSLMRFFLLHVVSEGMEEHNPLPMPGSVQKTKAVTLLERERQRDDYLREWENRFLAAYRTNPEDPRSDFYPVFVPDAPPLPEIDRAYVGGAIKLAAITGQTFPIYSMRPEVDKAFVSRAMKEVLSEMAPDEIPDPVAERVRVPVPGGYQSPQERQKTEQNNANNPNNTAGGGAAMMPGMGGGGMGGGGLH